MRILLLAAVASAFSAEVCGGYLEYDPFPAFDTIPADELLPPNAGLTVTADGSLEVDGRPRYFPATFWYGGFEYAPCNPKWEGPSALAWLYNEMPTYESVSRMGFDASGLSCTFKWMRMYRPHQKEGYCDWKKSLPSFKCGLPLYMDFTASEWGLGSMNMGDRPVDPDYRGKIPDAKEKRPAAKAKPKTFDLDDELPGVDDFDPVAKRAAEKKPDEPWLLTKDAFTVGHNHWVAYSTVHPKGRRIWLNMWKYGTQEVLDLGLRPWCYELFNEPSVWDTSDWAKKEFAGRMKARFGADWEKRLEGPARGVEYSKYLEERFASLMDEGTAEIRKLLPSALTTFQPCTIRTRGLDLFRCYERLGVVCSQTGGRGIMEAHMLRGLADGKPIVDNEMYIGNSTNSIRNSYLDQYQRGFNASYAFKWSGDRSGYNFMNPNNVRADALLGVRLAKRDIMDVNEFFTPRRRGVPHEVAVLFSNPTERLAQHTKHGGYRLFDQAVVGIDAAQLPLDVLWEEYVTNTTSRLERYKVLVTAGTDAVFPGTIANIRKWVERGGILVCFDRVPSLDEYGRPNPEAFAVEPGEHETGRGRVFFYPDRMSAQAMGEKVVAAAALAGVKPDCEVLDAAEEGKVAANPIEVHSAARDGMRAWIVTARTMSDKVVRFKPSDLDPSALMVRVWNEAVTRDGKTLMVGRRQVIRPDAEGYYGLFLRRGDATLLVAGRKDAVLKRYPKRPDVEWAATALRSEDVIREGLAKLAARKEAKASAGFRYDVDPERVRTVDLASVANAKMQDLIGINPAEKGPVCWDTDEFAGVPVKILRYDQNGFRDCLAAKAGLGTIALPEDAGNVYILHTGTLSLVFEYADGVTVERETGAAKRRPGMWRWTDSRANGRLKGVKVMPSGDAVILAVSTERRDENRFVVPDDALAAGQSGGGVRCIVTNGVCRVELDESAGSWCTAGFSFKTPVPCAKGMYTKMTVEVNRLPDQWGVYHDHATPQFKVFGHDRKGRTQLGANWIVGKWPSGSPFYRADADPETWETMTFFVSDGFIPANYHDVSTFRLQFQQMPAQHSGLAFRNFTFWRNPDYRPSEEDESQPPAVPGAPSKKPVRRSPKFESSGGDTLGLSLDE